ncbi:MAG TPA: pitrilysin family protein [Acidimicrobiales bacterium]|nr:pitrilysin family protein [Acidimicrobiales bacterium]
MIRVAELDCGIRLVTEKMPGVRSVCTGFWVGTGSRDETPTQAGISHFLEHLLFKGTAARSARSIAEDIDAVGGDMNAFTTKEYTTFYVRTLAEDLDLGLDILCDILWDPALRPDEVDAERQVILEEVLMHLDEPADVVQERFGEALFPGHPLGREVLGVPEVITGVSVPEIRSFFDEHYRPANMVVAVAGDVDHERVAAGIEARFAGAALGGPPSRTAPDEDIRALDVLSRDTEQAHLVVGVRGPDRRSPERFALSLLNHSLGGGISSRLFQKIREERGLAYSVVSDRIAFADAGALAVSVGTAPERAREVLRLVLGELDDLAASGVSMHELELAKSHLRADTILSLEDSGARMSRIGASLLLHGEVLTVEEVTANIEAVTLDEVAEIASRVLGGPRVLAVVGPFSSDEFSSEVG